MPTFRYQSFKDAKGKTRTVPMLRVWKDPRVRYLAVVDSGADQSCLPPGVAADLGVTYDANRMEPGFGVGGATDFWIATSVLELMSDAGPITLPEAHIHPNLPMILLGRADVFIAYKVAFNQRGLEFTMTPYKRK